MNRKKLNNYNLTASYHTMAIKSPGIVQDVQPEVAECISSSSRNTQHGSETVSVINPNKLGGDALGYTDFCAAFDTILAGAGIKDYSFIRADMRFDNYDPEHYHRYAKLNRYLISALAVTYNIKNAYRTENLFNQRQMTVAIKNDYFEVENYDRAAKSAITQNHVEPAKARLEERTVSRGFRTAYKAAGDGAANLDVLRNEFTDVWFARWDKALRNMDLVHKRYNDELERIYKEQKDARPKQLRSLTDFLLRYQDCIFCKDQLVDLLSRFEEVENPVTRAENFRKKYKVEFFDPADVRTAVAEVKRATAAFFAK